MTRFVSIHTAGDDSFAVADAEHPCPKCGGSKVKVYWHPGVSSYPDDWKSPGCHRSDLGTSPLEHLHVYCQLCRYSWIEMPEDHQP